MLKVLLLNSERNKDANEDFSQLSKARKRREKKYKNEEGWNKSLVLANNMNSHLGNSKQSTDLLLKLLTI